MNPINFDPSLYDDYINGFMLWKGCNKRFRPTLWDQSYDKTIEENDIWFIKRDYLDLFFSNLDSRCPNINIVTQHSDREVDDELMKRKPRCIRKIFGPNNTSKHPSAIPIPLGLSPPYCNISSSITDIKTRDANKARDCLLYVNFNPDTNISERQPLLNKFLEMHGSWFMVGNKSNSPKSVGQYLDEMMSHKFCICPRGNGVDTHRIWECLYSRTIPVVKYEYAHRNFMDLPILFVSDWEEIDEDFLLRKYDEICEKKWDFSKMSASWWWKQFRL